MQNNRNKSSIVSKILILTKNQDIQCDLTNLLSGVGYEAVSVETEKDAIKTASNFAPDIAIIDTSITDLNITSICRSLKLQNETNDTQIILLTSKDSPSQEVLVGADGYITKPFNENILIATVNAHLRIKKLLDILYTNNSELAKSLYQLNVLYNISSQLAGTLDKTKLINIMNTGLDKSLNALLSHALIMNEPEDATLIINSQYPITETLENALKLRAMLAYKSLFDDNKLPFELSMDNIRVEKHVKEQDGELDLSILTWDRMFSPISTADKFFGTVEIIRKNEFSGEDSTCFQTVVKQVALPLESALLYEEIQKTNIKLEKLEKLKSEFISIVSHELRTPLTSIKNSLEMMLSGRMGEVTDVQENFLALAKRNVDRLSGIINDLLDLSKIEAGKMEYRFEPLNILEPVKFVISTFENLAEKKNIKLALIADKEEFITYGDCSRLEQVLNNLVSNAIKFTPNSGKININIEEVPPDFLSDEMLFSYSSLIHAKYEPFLAESYIKVSVEDTGIGIKTEDIPKVFDKFQQIESSLSREVGGTGLGLPIAMQLIEAHRGIIWLESEFEKGSKFSFIIPVIMKNNTFLFELDNYLQKAKYNHSEFSLIITEEENCNSEKSVLNFAKSLKKEYIKVFSEDNKTKIILPDSGEEKLLKLVGSIEKHAVENNLKIKTGFSTYPKDAITSEELVDFAQKTGSVIIENDNSRGQYDRQR
jgi:signal transduction histidine kinase/CheY-like chemotaxis protein